MPYKGKKRSATPASKDKTKKKLDKPDVKAATMTEEEIGQFINDRWRIADNAERELRDDWDAYNDLFNNKQDYSKKEDWQSKLFFPKTQMSIERAVSLIVRGVMDQSKLFTFDTAYGVKTPSGEEAAKKHEEKRKEAEEEYKSGIDDSNLSTVTNIVTKEAFTYGRGVYKCLIASEDKFSFQAISPYNIYADPDATPELPVAWVMERKELTTAKLRALSSTTNDKAASEVWKTKNIEKMISGGSSGSTSDEEDVLDEQKDMPDDSTEEQKYEILEYYGDINDAEGYVAYTNQLIMIEKSSGMILRMQDNPLPMKVHPYVFVMPMLYPHRGTIGISLIKGMAGIQRTYNNLWNLIMDNMAHVVNKTFVIDKNAIENPRTLSQFYPGKQIYTKPNYQGQAVREVPTQPIGSDVFNAASVLDREIQGATGVNEFVNPVHGKEKTATEAKLKTAESHGFFEYMARSMERSALEPLLQKALAYYEVVSQGTSPHNYKKTWRVRVSGISLLLDRQAQIENLEKVIALTQSDPRAAEIIDYPATVESWLSLQNMENLYKEPPPQQELEQQQAIQAAQQQPQGVPQGQQGPPQQAQAQVTQQDMAIFMDYLQTLPPAAQQEIEAMSKDNPQGFAELVANTVAQIKQAAAQQSQGGGNVGVQAR